MARQSLPHARGGVSGYEKIKEAARLSSPRPWGCFLNTLAVIEFHLVFPTPVGVFPTRFLRLQAKSRLPHARGGVSAEKSEKTEPAPSSPRPKSSVRGT